MRPHPIGPRRELVGAGRCASEAGRVADEARLTAARARRGPAGPAGGAPREGGWHPPQALVRIVDREAAHSASRDGSLPDGGDAALTRLRADRLRRPRAGPAEPSALNWRRLI